MKIIHSMNGISRHRFATEGGQNVLILDWDFEKQEFPKLISAHGHHYTVVLGRCYDLRKPRNLGYFWRNWALFHRAIEYATDCIKNGTAIQSPIDLKDGENHG